MTKLNHTLALHVLGMFCLIMSARACYASAHELHYGPMIVSTEYPNKPMTRWLDVSRSIRILTQFPGTQLESYSYSPFGTRTVRNAIGNEIPNSTYGVTLGFGNRPVVKHLNTLDFHYRLYNQRDGSFLTRDPLHYIDTQNERQYAMHNPIDFTDYHGLMSQGGQTTAQGAGTGAPVTSPTGNPTGDGEKPNGPNICVNGGAPATNLPWIMQNAQLQSPDEYERRLREKLDELIEQHGEDIITAHENGALVPWARSPQYVIWLLNGDRPAFQATISTQSRADLAKALIKARKPKPHEPGGWAFNALGPHGAAYELMAVFAGVTAAPRVFRGSTAPAPTHMPTALIPRSPRIRPVTAVHTPSNAAHDPTFPGPKPSLSVSSAAGGGPKRPTLSKTEILQVLSKHEGDIVRPRTLRMLAARVRQQYGDNEVEVYLTITPSTNVVPLTRLSLREIEQAGNSILFATFIGRLVPDQIMALNRAGFETEWIPPPPPEGGPVAIIYALIPRHDHFHPGRYTWYIETLHE